MAGGSALGTNGSRDWQACAAVAAFAGAVCTVNALSIAHDASQQGLSIAAWSPWAEEYSSFAGILAALPVAVAAMRAARRTESRSRQAALLVLGSLLFSLVHVASMVVLREFVWWSQGRDYSFDAAGDWLYEYRKDLVGYGVALLFLTVAARLPARINGVATDAKHGLVRLSDGRREVEVDPMALRAICGGGNYSELIFADGRRRLLRSTLAAVEAALAGHGFVRTHKSWLVRLDCIEAVESTGGGDFRLRVAGGAEARLARRRSGAVRAMLAQPSSARSSSR